LDAENLVAIISLDGWYYWKANNKARGEEIIGRANHNKNMDDLEIQ
jgi:hypothetical protein